MATEEAVVEQDPAAGTETPAPAAEPQNEWDRNYAEADKMLTAEREAASAGAPKSEPAPGQTEQPAAKPADSAPPAVSDPEIVLEQGRKVKLSELRQWEGAHKKFTETQQALARDRERLAPLDSFQKHIRDPKNAKYAQAIEDLLDAQKLESYLAWATGQAKPATSTVESAKGAPAGLPPEVQSQLEAQNARLAEQQKVIDEWNHERRTNEYARQIETLRSSRPELKAMPEEEWKAFGKKLVGWVSDEIDSGNVNTTVEKAYRYHAFEQVADFMGKQGAAQQQVRQLQKQEAGKILPGVGGANGRLRPGQLSEEERDAALRADATKMWHEMRG